MAQQRDFGAVLNGAKAGEPWAVGVLFEDLQPRLLRYLRSRDHVMADDLAADVWEAIARRIHDFEGDESSFRGWAFTIARRRLIDHRRQQGRRRTDPADEATFTQIASGALPDLAVVERLSAQEAIAIITAVLPEDQAEVVLLRVIGGLDTSVVAEVMERTENWVRVTQHRALKRLAERFVPEASGSM